MKAVRIQSRDFFPSQVVRYLQGSGDISKETMDAELVDGKLPLGIKGVVVAMIDVSGFKKCIKPRRSVCKR